MKTMILAGGLGTRLRQVVKNRPKALLAIEGRPFLEYLVLQLRRNQLTEVVLCTGHLGDEIRSYFADGRAWGMRISYSHESSPLGTAGAIKLAEGLIAEENFLVMNGDSFLDVDLNKLIDHHLVKDALATMALVEAGQPARYGAVDINATGEIETFVEKGQISRSKLINGGVYVLSRKVFDRIPEGKVSLEKEVFPGLIGKGFYGMPVRGFFMDVGVPQDYERLRDNPKSLLELESEREEP